MFQACPYYTPTKPEYHPRDPLRISELWVLRPAIVAVTILPALNP
jgi:hypothetical protein